MSNIDISIFYDEADKRKDTIKPLYFIESNVNVQNVLR